MTVIGFHASHEQISPRQLLRDVKHAEQAGFDAAMCSDHIAPWSRRQGESGFAWAWLGAALEGTDLRLGVVNAPGQRYHPAIIAQAIATLGQMYPGRFWAALGSGENANEHITGQQWPLKADRNARLKESVDIIRALLAGEEVTHFGHVTVDRARIWSRPDVTPPLIAPAVSPETAGWAAEWADGLATINAEEDAVAGVIDAYRTAGGRGPVVLQVHLSFDADEEKALAIAYDQWRSNVFSPPLCWDLETVEQFDEASKFVKPDDVRTSVLVSSEPEWFADRLASYVALGVDEVYLHHVGKEQSEFLDVFGERVLPRLREATG
jgi:probable non-F420 flavinoid oxidoreductase